MKKLLLSLNNILLLFISILCGLLFFATMKNQQHNQYIINLSNKSSIIANNLLLKINDKDNDYYYSMYSIKENKIIDANLPNQYDNKIKFTYPISKNNDLIIVNIYEKNLDYSNLFKLMCNCTILLYLGGFILLYIIDKKIILSKEVEKLHFMDNLTQLYNKVKFAQTLEDKIKQKNSFYVIATDIEDFKRINQLSGYEAGDLLLKNYALGLKLKKMIKSPARISGNQFIFYIESKDLDLEKKSLEKILENMATEIYSIEHDNYKIKQNIGISKYPENSLNAEELIKFAELAMHNAKDSKKSIGFYSEIMLEKINQNNMIKKELLNAIEHNEIYLVFQPKVDISNNKIYAEVLVRWKNNKLGFIAPDIFIEIAEKTGEIYKLGKWIFEEAIKEIEKYNNQGKEINLSINLSPKQLINKYIFDDFIEVIKKHNVKTSQVTLEITESLMLDKDDVLDLLNKFSESGIKISIDDFGKGHSSFSYLKDYPINEVKLDKTFVDEIEKTFNAHLVESIANLSKKLNVSLVVEGVETKEQVQTLLNLGCSFFQGYYYSKPLNSIDFAAYIEKKLDL